MFPGKFLVKIARGPFRETIEIRPTVLLYVKLFTVDLA